MVIDFFLNSNYPSLQSTHQNIVYAQSSSRTLGELITDVKSEPLKSHNYQNAGFPVVASPKLVVRTYENVNYDPERDCVNEEPYNNEDYYNNSQLTIDSTSTATNEYVNRNMLSPGSATLPSKWSTGTPVFAEICFAFWRVVHLLWDTF